MIENGNNLVNDSIKKLILTLAIPSILGQVLDIGYNIIDGIFIGQWVGENGLAGIGLALPITLVNMAISIMIAVGTSTAIGRYIGQKRIKESSDILSLGLFYSVLLNGILSVVIIVFGEEILMLMGIGTSLNSQAMSYLSVVSIGFVFMGIAMLLCDVLRNEGLIIPTVVVMLIGMLGNIVLDVVFMYFIPLGMLGAGIATLGAQFIALIYILFYYRFRDSLKISFSDIKFEYSKEIFSIGAGVFLREIVEAIVIVIYNYLLLKFGGVLYLAAFSIINKIIMVVYMPVGGFAEGLQPIISVNYGANRNDRVHESIRIGVVFSTIYAIIAVIGSYQFRNNIIGIFGGTKELLNITEKCYNIMIMGLIFIPVTIIATTLFQGVNKPKESLIVNLSRQCIFLLPFLIILPNYFGVSGVFYSTVISEILSCITSVFLIDNYFTKLKLNTKPSTV
ncbi:MAG: MATE family efflux transporter [Nitrososphaeraceae archaeon]